MELEPNSLDWNGNELEHELELEDMKRTIVLNRQLFDLRKIYGMNLKTGHQKKMPYVGEFASWDLS